MQKLATLFIGLCSLARLSVFAADEPRGNLLELHSCELYAGGCIVSSEATLGGRYMVRAWDFTGGGFSGADFTGLRVAVLQSSSQNLAERGADPGQAVVYLPEAATSQQREALLAWLKSGPMDLARARLQTRTVPVQFSKTKNGYAISAGNYLSLQTDPLETCETGVCGEALWYEPRTPTSVFTVAVDRSSRVVDPLLELKWVDAGKRSVFLARFGDSASAKNLYVSTAEICAPNARLF